MAPRALFLDGPSNLRSYTAKWLLEDLVSRKRGVDYARQIGHGGGARRYDILGERGSEIKRVHNEDRSARRPRHILDRQPGPPSADDVSVSNKRVSLALATGHKFVYGGLLHLLKI